MRTLRSSLIRLAASEPADSPLRTEVLKLIASEGGLFIEAEKILHEVAALAASQLDGKVLDVSGFGPSGVYDSDGNPKVDWASGNASVNLPKLPDFYARGTALLQINVSADMNDGQVEISVHLYGTIKPVDEAFSKVMRGDALSGTPDQVRSKLRAWVGKISTVLEGDFVQGSAVKQALPALEKAEADLKQMLEGVAARLGGEVSYLHQRHPPRMLNEVIVETVGVGIKGLLSTPDREAAREAYAKARQALVKACKGFRSGDMQAMVSSQPGYWSSYELQMYLHIYQGNTAPLIRAASSPAPVVRVAGSKMARVVDAGSVIVSPQEIEKAVFAATKQRVSQFFNGKTEVKQPRPNQVIVINHLSVLTEDSENPVLVRVITKTDYQSARVDVDVLISVDVNEGF